MYYIKSPFQTILHTLQNHSFKSQVISCDHLHRSPFVPNGLPKTDKLLTLAYQQIHNHCLQQIHSLSTVYRFENINSVLPLCASLYLTHLEHIKPPAGASSPTWGIFPFLVCMTSFKYQIKPNHHVVVFPYTLTA